MKFLKKNKKEFSTETLNLYRNRVNNIKTLILENNDKYLSTNMFYSDIHQMWIYLANIIEYYANKNNIKYRSNIYFESNNHFLSRSKILEEFSKSLIKKENKKHDLLIFGQKLASIDLLFFNAEPFIFNNNINKFNIFNNVKLSIFILNNIDLLIELDDFCRNN